MPSAARTKNDSKEKDLKVYILRHAMAEPRGPGVTEANRKLTPDGELELKAVLKQARKAGVKPEAILSSPWIRALETARMAAKALKCERLTETRSLLPDAQPAQLLREIRAVTNAKEVLVAGHEPQLSHLAAFLLEAPLALDFKKSAIVRVDIEPKDGPPRGVLKWMLTPRLAGRKGRNKS
jgi:phosphohistidine phosphatase